MTFHNESDYCKEDNFSLSNTWIKHCRKDYILQFKQKTSKIYKKNVWNKLQKQGTSFSLLNADLPFANSQKSWNGMYF